MVATRSKTPVAMRYDTDIACPVCGTTTKGCSLFDNGGQSCRGTPVIPSDWKLVSECSDGEFRIYKPADSAPAGKSRKQKTPPAPKPINWSARIAPTIMRPDLAQKLCADLGLPPNAVKALPMIGYPGDTAKGVIAHFPEVDPAGLMIGVIERDPSQSPKSKMLPGGSRGLYPAAGWDTDHSKPLFVVEGATDTLACYAAGMSVVGRPGAGGGAEYLAELIKKCPADRQIIIVGENDQKPNGDWPGKTLGNSLAIVLSKSVPNPVKFALVPPEAKDSREWLSGQPAGMSWAERGERLAAHLVATAEVPFSFQSPDAPSLEPKREALKMVSASVPPWEWGDDPRTWPESPSSTGRLALMYLHSIGSHDPSCRTLRFFRQHFWRWFEGCYYQITQEEMVSEMMRWMYAESLRVRELELANHDSTNGGKKPVAFVVTTALASNVVRMIGSMVEIKFPQSEAPEPPFWLDGATGPDPLDIVPMKNGLVNLLDATCTPHTPHFFNTRCVGYAFTPEVKNPVKWLAFLNDIWGDDAESIQCLREWFGYLLTSDTRQHKMLALVGPPRSGKSTIEHVLTQLVGGGNVCAPAIDDFAQRFGLSQMVNASLAILDDTKVSPRSDVVAIVGALKRISGGASVSIDRKNLPILTTTLRVRFVFSANEVPQLGDVSGTLASRFVTLATLNSFLGRENFDLKDELTAELSAIFNWAMQGLQSLRKRGRLFQPISGQHVLDDIRNLGSPMISFVTDLIVFEPGAEATTADLYEKWGEWCVKEGRNPGNRSVFSRDLIAVIGKEHRPIKKRVDGVLHHVYQGVRLAKEWESGSGFLPFGSPAASGTDVEHQQSLSTKSTTVCCSRYPNCSTSCSRCVPDGKIPQSVDNQELVTTVPDCSRQTPNREQNIETVVKETIDVYQGDKVGVPGLKLEHNRELSGTSGTATNPVNIVSNTPGLNPDLALYFSENAKLDYLPATATAPVVSLAGELWYLVTPRTAATLLSIRESLTAGPDQNALDAILGDICAWGVRMYGPDLMELATRSPALPLPAFEAPPS